MWLFSKLGMIVDVSVGVFRNGMVIWFGVLEYFGYLLFLILSIIIIHLFFYVISLFLL